MSSESTQTDSVSGRSPTADCRLPTAHTAGGKVLVLGDGTTSFLSVIRSLGRRGIQVHAAWCDEHSPALRSRYVFRAERLPKPQAGAQWLPALETLMRQERFDLVIPTNEQSIRPLEQHRERLSAAGRIYLLGDRACDVLLDKSRSAELAASVGMPVPRRAIAKDLTTCRRLAEEFGWPLVVKPLSSYRPDDLRHRQEVVKAANEAELDRGARALLERGPVLVQECFAGDGVGLEVLASAGEVLAAFQHERVHSPPRGGASSYRKSVPVSPEFLTAAKRLVAELGYTGVLMIELLVNRRSGQWCFVETNPRFWGSLPLAVAAGMDFPYYLYQLLVHGVKTFPTAYRTGLFCRNLPGDLIWLRQNQQADRHDPTVKVVPARQIVQELGNVVLGRERWDSITLDDPWPGVVELGQLAIRYGRRTSATAARRLAALPLCVPAVRRARVRQTRAALRAARSVLFVCLGNICRSPFAEAYARSALAGGIEIRSRGILPRPDRPSPPAAVSVASELGVDLSQWRSAPLAAADVATADAVFSFDENVHQELRRRYPSGRRKLFRFGLLDASGPIDVPDPFGGSEAEFRAVYRRIAATLDCFRQPREGRPQAELATVGPREELP